MAYEINSTVTLFGTFTAVAGGTPADPDVVTLWVQRPDGSKAAHVYPTDVTRDGPGAYHMDIAADQAGVWTYKWVGDGVFKITSPDITFAVKPSAFLPSAGP